VSRVRSSLSPRSRRYTIAQGASQISVNLTADRPAQARLLAGFAIYPTSQVNAYLRDLLEHINAYPKGRLAELLPDQWKAARQIASKEKLQRGEATVR